MGVMSVHRLLLATSIPMVISMLVQALYNITDSIFVAHFSETALTAVTMAFPIQFLMISVGIGTGVGINAFLSKSLGEKNYRYVNRTATNGLFLAGMSFLVFVVIGVFATDWYFQSQTSDPEILRNGREYMMVVCIFSYAIFAQVTLERLLMSTGKTIYSMYAQLSGAVVNIILDPIMIFGLLGCPRLGVMGAALATVIGQTVASLVALHLNLKKNTEINLSFKGFRPDWRIIRRIYSVGVPSILMASLGAIMTYGLNAILLSFSTTAVAVFGVYFRLQSFIVMPVFGLNNGMVPIIAYNYGARKRDRIDQTIKLSVMYAVSIMVLGMIIFQLFPVQILRLFNASPTMLAIGVPALRIISTHFIFASFCIIFISVFQALGNGIESLIIAFARQLIFILPIAWLLSLTGNIHAVWWAFPIAEGATLIFSFLMLRRVYNRKLRYLTPLPTPPPA
ncbi:MAG: MATE family efflux transporter [Planctomycetota bacterium]|jgi:putative MATE family efflux protein|nr:MATE family efflux transporter [Planctomycetota bacterium]